ncbi:MAG: hypothetical protein M1832_000830 [Thelocarpon impressellum]|nr:MAG: hypothetical protein M1832_000830 [Thelocarpon impressellum]
MRIPLELAGLVARDERPEPPEPEGLNKYQKYTIVGDQLPRLGATLTAQAAIVVVLSLLAIFYCYMARRHLRRFHAKFLKEGWLGWTSGSSGKYNRASDGGDVGLDLAREIAASRQSSTSQPETATETEPETATVGRNTSVRSVQTLPVYMATPAESERILGREGERAGIDIVLEFPETAEEEEERREGEMESLYQLRVARQRENAEREERRRARRAAREAGDLAALEELRMRSRQRAASNAVSAASVSSLPIPDDGARPGGRRRISSVSYADVGLARADGTRIRAGSTESERPLLEGAASIGSTHHERARSNSSAISVSTAGSDNIEAMQEVELGAPQRQMTDPPTYDDAPPYEAPSNVPPRLPSVRGLPAIRVTGGSPGVSAPATPVEGRGGF